MEPPIIGRVRANQRQSHCPQRQEPTQPWNGSTNWQQQRRLYHSTLSTHFHGHQNYNHRYQNYGYSHRAFGALAKPPLQPEHEDDTGDEKTARRLPPLEDDAHWLDEEIERLASSSYHTNMDDYVDDNDDDYETINDTHEDDNLLSINHERQQRLRMEHSSLDLELGETSVWDAPRSTSVLDVFDYLDVDKKRQQDKQEDEDENDVATSSTTKRQPMQFPSFPDGSPAAELHRQKLKQQVNPRKYQPVLSPLDMLEQLDNSNSNNSPTGQTRIHLIRPPHADPLSYQGPPPDLFSSNNNLHQSADSNTVDNKDVDLQQVQLQLECEAQREAILKYQKLTDQTRSRKDYASLNSMQKLILHWYQPIRDEIEAVQDEYIFKKKAATANDKKKRKSKIPSTTTTTSTTKPGINKYGPLLNTVDPEKLAVITTHEALSTSILVSHESTNHDGGCPVVLLAQKLGKAVEEEVLLQRVLKQHMEDERIRELEKEAAASTGSDQVLALANDILRPQSSDAAASEEKDSNNKKEPNRYSYVESRLTAYLQQIAGDGADNVSAKNRRNIAYAVRRARRLLNTDEWTIEDRVNVGAILLKILLDHAAIRLPDGTFQPAFRMERRWHKSNRGNPYYFNNNNPQTDDKNKTNNNNNFKSTNVIMVHDALLKLAVSDEFESIAASTTRYKPMVIPPTPWTSPNDGGYAWLKTDFIRFHGSQMQREALDMADLTAVFDGLNALSREPWIINKTILKVAQECWKNNVSLGDIPSQTDLEVPPEPTPPEKTTFLSSDDPHFDEEYAKIQKQQWVKEYTAYKESNNRYRRVLQKNRDMFSLRCSAKLKLGQAEQFKDYENIYFPYNMDFRGRAYPVPPHLSNVGSDLCRGMLRFAKKKPLGKRGLFWLQVHLANLAGKDKMTFEDRAQYSRDNLDNIRKAVEDPFGQSSGDPDERPWWMTLDDPFQGLSTCHEIINAIDSGNPETYMCGMPVHMDGSCNGLQHYAALGLDLVGGTAVNLCNYPEPQDVYIGVMEEVIRRVDEEAKRELDFDESSITGDDDVSRKRRKELARNRSAKLVNGLIDRGVVKRTVMTSVYGVTYIGARQQIQEKIEEKVSTKYP